MSLDDATRIVTRLGPRAVAIDRARESALAQQLALLGCVVSDSAETVPVSVAVVRWHPDMTKHVSDRIDTLVVISAGEDREQVEPPLLAGGWARHPAGLIAAEAGCWSPRHLPRLSFYRRADASVPNNLLTCGAAADAAIARFACAADVVRSGDRVVIGGLDADAGGAIVAALSRGRDVVTVMEPLLGAFLAQPERSIDTIILTAADGVAFDAPLLVAAERVLKADGRIVLGWQDGSNPDPSIEDLFIIERCIGPFADGGTLLVVSANPLAATETASYRHPAFHGAEGSIPTLVDFADAYENPHLYRVMVQLGERLGDDIKLARLAECVLGEAGAASADRGAAITVLGYRVLDRGLIGSVPTLVALIDDYLAATEGSNAPHVVRWRLSSMFLAGRLAELADQPAVAIDRFHAASLADWQGFSPILATKAIAAAFHEARLHLATDARAAAMACFRRGLDTALTAAAAPHDRLIGDPPLPFYCQEMAEIFDMGGQCAIALANAHMLDRDPGLFWRQIDTKRFGLFAWADGLAREQAKRSAA